MIKSALKGSSEGQFEVGFLYNNNLLQQSALDQVYEELKKPKIDLKVYPTSSLSLLNFLSSSMSGNTKSAMALGYKYFKGYQVEPDCKRAAKLYQIAADETKESIENGAAPFVEKVKLEDDDSLSQKQTLTDVMEYYKYSAQKGVSTSQLIYGYANLYGLRGVNQNIEQAIKYFEMAASAGESEAYGPLGNMYLKGIGVEKDFEKAKSYFTKGIAKGDPNSFNGLGNMYLNGIGVTMDVSKAFTYFNASSSKGNPEGQYYYGYLFLKGIGTPINYKNAFNLFTVSAQQHNVLAYYQLGVMALNGLGMSTDCNSAVKFFKMVAEKGPTSGLLDQGYNSFLEGNYRDSFLYYQKASDLGYENGQLNLVYMLEKELIDDYFNEIQKNVTTTEMIFKYHKLLSDQGNVKAMVKVGDHYYYGTGVEVNIDKSVINYRKAVDLGNPQAMFNLGYMHEHGEGLPKDYYLAKRYYDMARDTKSEAYMPVVISLSLLYIKWAYQLIWDKDLRGGIPFNVFEFFYFYEDVIFTVLLAFFFLLISIKMLLYSKQIQEQQNE